MNTQSLHYLPRLRSALQHLLPVAVRLWCGVGVRKIRSMYKRPVTAVIT
ncbi:hypothetical protein [Microbulbifer rhizosphaerae]|uniref:Uncharacterized protein n=1 Tax=Microbulbifer rhizosphaerae TaxID=1562603 RepID=A0A7W4Z9M3_9GAMM|nr:hypothetical protein [Microbulbifer rhizosphaerae]MBB3061721.1 hypothetical protein [Microbulbifer rhizosphaerae]